MKAREIPVFEREPDPLGDVLDIWVRWSRRDDLAMTHRDRAGGCDDEDLPYVKADIRTAEAVHVMIFDLKPIHRWAIQKKCSVLTVWRFPNADYLKELAEAEAILVTKMKLHSDTRNYFDCATF